MLLAWGETTSSSLDDDVASVSPSRSVIDDATIIPLTKDL